MLVKYKAEPGSDELKYSKKSKRIPKSYGHNHNGTDWLTEKIEGLYVKQSKAKNEIIEIYFHNK